MVEAKSSHAMHLVRVDALGSQAKGPSQLTNEKRPLPHGRGRLRYARSKPTPKNP